MQKQHIAIALVVSVLLAAACSAPNAAADILLKAVGKNEISLRPKTMDSQIDIHGQIAQIKTTLVMASELDQQSEADFEYTVPDNTLVTYFAYWYKGKKVVARIVTKERAAEIYRIVSNHKVRDHRHWTYSDPAIVEMKDKNTFHVRIFPIEANADLKVEIHSVQMLDGDAKGAVFTFPLKAPEKNKGTFEKIHLHLQLHPDHDVSGIFNNYNLPLIREDGVQTLDLAQQNWRAPQDLKVRFTRAVHALNASLCSARASGENGFFALIIVPSQDIPHLQLQIQGIKTWQLLPSKLAPMKAHVPVLVTGRYSGSGTAKVLLHGYDKNGVLSGTAKVLFSSQKAQPNPAALFWAKLQMQHLATNTTNKSAVMQLSKRFNLPSKYTSWLALPEEGRKVYEKNLANSKIDEFGPKLAKLIADGKGKSTSARHLREVINQQSRIIDENPDDVVADYLGGDIGKTINDIIHAKQQNDTDVNYVRKKQSHLRMLLSFIPQNTNRYIKSQLDQITKTDYRSAATRYVSQAKHGKTKSPEAQALLGHIQRLYNKHSSVLHTPKRIIADEAWSYSQKLAGAISEEKIKPDSDRQKLQKLKSQLQQFAKATNSPANEFLKGADEGAFLSALNNVMLPTSHGYSNQKFDPDWHYAQRVIAAKKLAPVLGKRLGLSVETQKKFLSQSTYSAAQAPAKKYFLLQDDNFVNYAKAQKIREQLQKMADAIDVPYEDLVDEQARDWAYKQMGYRKRLANKIVDIEQNDHPSEGRLLKLKGKLEKVAKILSYVPEHFTTRANGGLFNATWNYHHSNETAQEYLQEVRFDRIAKRVGPKIRDANFILPVEQTLKNPDTKYDKQLEQQREEALKGLPPAIRDRLTKKDRFAAGNNGAYYAPNTLYIVRNLLLREYRKDDPDKARVAELKSKLIDLEKHAGYLSPEITNPTLYGNLRAQRLELRANREKIEEKIESESDPSQLRTLKDQKATIMAQQKKLIARMGDPLISVQAPDADSVVALMPDGETKQLVYDAQKDRWEARFDIPANAVEGKYTIQIIVVRKDGSRQMLAMNYSVDLTPPAGNAQMKVIDKNYSGQKVLRLQVQTDENAARVSALLPWGDKVDLAPSEAVADQFFVLTNVPDGFAKSTYAVTFVLTDKAHNRMEITVDSTSGK